jgi:hypothetical protein
MVLASPGPLLFCLPGWERSRVHMCTCVRHIHSITHSVIFVFACTFVLGTEVVVVHRAHTSSFCSALQQLLHSVALLLLSAAASSVLDIRTACIVGLARATSASSGLTRVHPKLLTALRVFMMLTYSRDTILLSPHI